MSNSNDTTNRDRIRAYYARGAEWGRLESDDGWLEFVRTMRLVEQHVPAGSHILDLGGGPGRYTLALAAAGYRVTLVDLSPEQIEDAKARIADHPNKERIEGAHVGDALDLSPHTPKGGFDAVLCYGPLYHCKGPQEGAQILAQVRASLRPGGVALCAFIPRTTGVSGLIARAASCPEQLPPGTLSEVWRTGAFPNPVDGAFGEAWFGHVEEVEALVDGSGMERVGTWSLRGMGAGYCSAVRTLHDHHPQLFEEAMALIEDTSARPDIIGLGWHAVCLAHNPAP